MNAGADPPKLGERRRVLRRISPKRNEGYHGRKPVEAS